MVNNGGSKCSMDNRTNLIIARIQDYSSNYIISAETCERFLRAASLLPENEFLGLQIETTPVFSCSAFSSKGSKVTAEDIDWIFRRTAKTVPASSELMEDLHKENRRVYMLRSVEGSPRDVDVSEPGVYEIEDEFGCRCSIDGWIRYMFLKIGTAGGVIRFIAGGTKEKKGHGRGRIFISLPAEMELWRQATISSAFPHLVADELQEESDEMEYLPDKFFLGCMGEILTLLMREYYDAGPAAGSGPDDDINNDDIKSEEEPLDEYDFDSDTEEDYHIYSDTEEDCHPDSDTEREKNEFRGLSEDPALPQTSYMERLDALVGLREVKEQIKRIAAFAKMKQDMLNSGNAEISVALNMGFVGNPGTAKTTVARIAAGIFHEIGLLPSNELVEVGRSDLVGKYIGHTAAKVKEVFQRAIGKVLFIDEAYALVDERNGSFADEAINTIVLEMENLRRETIVIFAGYPDEMEKFFSRNPGLRSRVPFIINFSDYSVEEMEEISELEAKRQGFSISADAYGKISVLCAEAVRNPDSGNGRFCRNLIENAILSYADRNYGDSVACADKDYILAAGDFTSSPAVSYAPKKSPIGFWSGMETS